jgi:hypothetical protein
MTQSSRGVRKPLEHQPACAKIDQEACLQSTGLEIVDNLLVFSTAESIEGLELDENPRETYEVGAVSNAKGLSLVEYWYFHFPLGGNSPSGKLHG